MNGVKALTVASKSSEMEAKIFYQAIPITTTKKLKKIRFKKQEQQKQQEQHQLTH